MNEKKDVKIVEGKDAQISDLQNYLVNINSLSITELSDVFSSMTPTDGQVLTFDTTNGWQAESVATDLDVAVNVSINDTTPGFLNGKLVAGGGISLTENNDGGNETLTIASTGIGTDLVSVTVGRTTNVNIPTTFANITWNQTHVENNSSIIEHDNTNTERILIKESGTHIIAFSTSFNADAGEETITVRVLIDDTTVVPGSLRVASEDDEINDLSNVITAELTANTYITLQHQASGAGNVLHSSSNFMVTRAAAFQGDKGDPGTPGAGSTIIIEQDNVAVNNTPHSTLNFVDMEATDVGSGQVNIQNVFGSEFQVNESVGVSTTTSTTFQNKVTLNTTSLPTGQYRLGISYGWNHNNAGNDFEARIREDGINVGEIHKQESKDSAGSFSTTGTSQRYYMNRVFYRTLTAGTKTYTIDFRTDSAGVASSIWEAKIELWRVT
jgi:hypothetical protein